MKAVGYTFTRALSHSSSEDYYTTLTLVINKSMEGTIPPSHVKLCIVAMG